MCVFLYLSQTAKKFTEESFADLIRSSISDHETHDPQYYNISLDLDQVGTTHVSVLAEDGSAVSVTSTINHMSVSAQHSLCRIYVIYVLPAVFEQI